MVILIFNPKYNYTMIGKVAIIEVNYFRQTQYLV